MIYNYLVIQIHRGNLSKFNAQKKLIKNTFRTLLSLVNVLSLKFIFIHHTSLRKIKR